MNNRRQDELHLYLYNILQICPPSTEKWLNWVFERFGTFYQSVVARQDGSKFLQPEREGWMDWKRTSTMRDEKKTQIDTVVKKDGVSATVERLGLIKITQRGRG